MRDRSKANFKLVSEYSPTGDQPQAIEALVSGLEAGERAQTLVGVTGSARENVTPTAPYHAEYAAPAISAV